MKLVMNELRKEVVNVLSVSENPMTLAEVSEKLGKEVKSGSVNAMVQAGVVKKVGVKKVPVVAYREVAVYEVGDLSVLENQSEKAEK